MGYFYLKISESVFIKEIAYLNPKALSGPLYQMLKDYLITFLPQSSPLYVFYVLV